MQIEGLDEKDNQILDTIKDNARLTYKEIGDRVGLSRVAVKNRMNALQQRGIIQGYRTVINQTAAPSGIRFFLDVECAPEHYEDMAAFLAGYPMVLQIYGMTGESRIHAVGFASNRETLEIFANAVYRSSFGVRRMGCHTVLSTIMDREGGVEYVRYQKPEGLEGEGTGEEGTGGIPGDGDLGTESVSPIL